MSETTYDLTELRAKYQEIERQSLAGPLGLELLPAIDAWLQMLLDCHSFAIDCRRNNEHSDVMEAFASVSSVAFSNGESARAALLHGFYGNVLTSARSLAMANDLVIDLTTNAESARKCMALREFKPNARGRPAKELRLYFRDGVLRERVKQSAKYSPSQDLYAILSDPVHVTPWSTHLFSPEVEEGAGTYNLEYAPQYNFRRAVDGALLINLVLPHLSAYFLEFCHPRYGGNPRFEFLAVRHRQMMREHGPLVRRTGEWLNLASSESAPGW